MSRYQLSSHWHVDAPVVSVWNALLDVPRWTTWWSYVLAVETLQPGDARGIDAVHRLTWGTTVPHQLSFTMRRTVVQAPWRMEAVLEGDVNGTGRWVLQEKPGGTEVLHDWDVSTASAWMNALSPLLGPMFRWNHGLVMAEGALGLARHLGATRSVHS